MSATYMNREITDGVTTDESDPAKIEVTVSIGEFPDGETELSITTTRGFEMVGLDFTAAHRLMLALQDALNIHATRAMEDHEIATV